MKIWLDDIRKAPEGWLHFYWPEDIYPLLDKNMVTEISLDHDLGDDKRGTGYDIINYLEKLIVERYIFVPKIYIHNVRTL